MDLYILGIRVMACHQISYLFFFHYHYHMTRPFSTRIFVLIFLIHSGISGAWSTMFVIWRGYRWMNASIWTRRRPMVKVIRAESSLSHWEHLLEYGEVTYTGIKGTIDLKFVLDTAGLDSLNNPFEELSRNPRCPSWEGYFIRWHTSWITTYKQSLMPCR